MFSVAKGALWIAMLRGTHVRASAQNRGRKDTADDREAGYRALVRDVVLGGLAVIALSLAVPAWIIRVEYSKIDGAILEPRAPIAEVLRERTFEAVVVTPRVPRMLEVAEQIVRREAERRDSERREAERRETARRGAERRNATDALITENTDMPVDHAAAQPTETVPRAVDTQQFDTRGSVQAP